MVGGGKKEKDEIPISDATVATHMSFFLTRVLRKRTAPENSVEGTDVSCPHREMSLFSFFRLFSRERAQPGSEVRPRFRCGDQ